MIDLKTKQEIEIMKTGGKILADVLFEVLKNIKIGVSEIELDQLAEKLIFEKGGEPGFKKVEGYKHAICISTNDVVVHGIPTNYKLKEGDVVGIDCGVYYKGFHTDMAQTVRIKDKGLRIKEDEIDEFLKIGERVGNISKEIQGIVEGQGYSVVKSLVGHGVGRELHEDPEVPGFLDGSILETALLEEGMTIAIEVIYNMGKSDVIYSGGDGWTIKSKDGSLSGLFERSIAINNGESLILTK